LIDYAKNRNLKKSFRLTSGYIIFALAPCLIHCKSAIITSFDERQVEFQECYAMGVACKIHGVSKTCHFYFVKVKVTWNICQF